MWDAIAWHPRQGLPGCIRTVLYCAVGIKRLAANRSLFCIDARQVGEGPVETIVYSLVCVVVLLRTRSSSKTVGRKGERDLDAIPNTA